MREKGSPGNRKISNVGRKMLNVDREISNVGRKLLNAGRELPNVGRKLSNAGRKILNVDTGNPKWIAGSSLNRNWEDCGNCLNYD
jgi:hypothetical protein